MIESYLQVTRRLAPCGLVAASMLFALGATALAQQITGVPGSPSATTTIEGNQLPPPPPKFGGKIDRNAAQSTPYWPARVVPPQGAPNVLLIMTDDTGFGVTSTFGGVVPTPTLDKIAANGLRYTNFNSTSLCSPTRAAIITGRNHHSMGFGVIAEQSTGYPGYNSIMTRDKATVGKILKDNGYWTSWFGKDHNTPEFQASQAGPFDQWPIGMGFDYFYGFVGGDANQWQPNLFRNTSAIYPYYNNPGWNLITAMADDAIEYLDRVTAINPQQPFFVYYVPGAVHAPHHPTPEWIKKISDMHLFDEGWNKLRDTIFANQKRLGVIPQDAKLTPWPDDLLKRWDQLTADEKKLFIRQADVFAAYFAYADHEIGRVIQHIEDMGKLDNTLIIYIAGDNGNSAEGSLIGTPNEVASLQGVDVPVEDQLKFYDVGIGSDLSAHGGGLDLGLRHAVLMDQTDRVALRRGPAGHGGLVAGAHHRQGRRPQPVHPRDRHRADNPGSDRDQGAGCGRRHPAEADRRHELLVHLRQGDCERSLTAPYAVLRDDGRPCALS
jgi:arylsulfatase